MTSHHHVGVVLTLSGAVLVALSSFFIYLSGSGDRRDPFVRWTYMCWMVGRTLGIVLLPIGVAIWIAADVH
jgi:hypothetical protein